MSTDTHETDRGVASTPRRRSWSGWRYGLLAAVALPCLVTMIVRLERARELRLLEQAGAVLKVGLNNHTIVAAEFADVEVSAEIARQLVGHRDLWRLSFHDCRIAAGVFPLLETLPDLQVLELVGATWESSAEFRRFLSARRLAMVEFSGTGLDDDDLAALDLTEISVMTIRDCDRLSEAAILSLPAAGQLRTLVLGGVALTRGICRDIKARRPDLELSVSPADLAEFKPLVDAGVELRLDEELNVIGLGIESDASLLPLDFLKQCHHLQRLKIAGADVSADLLRAVCRCERLGFLSLEGSRIPGQELAGLARLVRLRSLNIDGVVVDGGSTLQLPRLPDLRACARTPPGCPTRHWPDWNCPRWSTSASVGRLLPPGWRNWPASTRSS